MPILFWLPMIFMSAMLELGGVTAQKSEKPMPGSDSTE
jgi:hypothetical protein